MRAFGIFALWASVAWGALAPEVGKVESGPCGAGPAVAGSAVVFLHGGQPFALASSASVIPDPRFCHRIHHPMRGSSDARWERSDWGMGLALLALTDPSFDTVGLGTSLDLGGKVPAVGSSALIHGFATELTTGPQSALGQVVIGAGVRHSLPRVRRTLEVQGGQVEAGFVGGPVVSPQGEFFGVLSRQYLKMTPGSATRPREWDGKPGHLEDHLLVLPAGEVSQWVALYFAGALPPSPYLSDAQAQSEGREEVQTGTLKFSLSCPDPWVPGSGPEPIGGGDGVGVGGAQASAPFCAAQLSSVVSKSPLPHASLAPWFQAVGKHLAVGRVKRLLYFAQRDPGTGILRRVPFWSLSDLFKSLDVPSLVPVLTDAPAPTEVPDPKWTAVDPLARKVQGIAQDVFGYFDIEAVRRLAREAHFLAEVAQSDQRHQLTAADLNGFLDVRGRHRTAWEVLDQWLGPTCRELRGTYDSILRLLPL